MSGLLKEWWQILLCPPVSQGLRGAHYADPPCDRLCQWSESDWTLEVFHCRPHLDFFVRVVVVFSRQVRSQGWTSFCWMVDLLCRDERCSQVTRAQNPTHISSLNRLYSGESLTRQRVSFRSPV